MAAVAVLDAKCAFDSMQCELLPTDRRTAIDIAVLKESLHDEEVKGFLRWVPGPQMICDALTKPHPNQAMTDAMEKGIWSLREDESFIALRAQQRERQKVSRLKPPSWQSRLLLLVTRSGPERTDSPCASAQLRALGRPGTS